MSRLIALLLFFSMASVALAIDTAVADGVDIISYSVGNTRRDVTAPDDLALMAATKAGVHGMARTWALELGPEDTGALEDLPAASPETVALESRFQEALAAAGRRHAAVASTGRHSPPFASSRWSWPW